jgi:hypothetical protein
VKMKAIIIAKLLLRLNSFLFLFLFSWSPVFAQVSTADVTGIVQDASSARIRDAAVKLINVETGAENDSTTSSDGRFILPGAIPGAYTLQIEREGFATMQLNGIILNVGDTKNLLIRLKVGSVTESVNVDASGLTLNTADASVSTVVDRKFVANIPLNGRSFQDLISMTPGVVTPSPQAAGQGSGTQGISVSTDSEQNRIPFLSMASQPTSTQVSPMVPRGSRSQDRVGVGRPSEQLRVWCRSMLSRNFASSAPLTQPSTAAPPAANSPSSRAPELTPYTAASTPTGATMLSMVMIGSPRVSSPKTRQINHVSVRTILEEPSALRSFFLVPTTDTIRPLSSPLMKVFF